MADIKDNLRDITENLSDIKGTVAYRLSDLKEDLTDNMTDIRDRVDDKITTIQEDITDGIHLISSSGHIRISSIRDGYESRVCVMGNKWYMWRDSFKERWLTLKQDTEDVIVNSLTISKETLEDVADRTLDRISDAAGEIKDSVSSVAGEIKDSVSSVKCTIVESFSGGAEKAKDTSDEIAETMENIREEVELQADLAVETIAETTETARQQVSDLSDDLRDNVTSLKRNFQDFSLHEKFCDAMDDVSEGLCTCSSKLSDTLYSVRSSLNGAEDGMDDVTIASELGEEASQASEFVEEGEDVGEISYSLKRGMVRPWDPRNDF